MGSLVDFAPRTDRGQAPVAPWPAACVGSGRRSKPLEMARAKVNPAPVLLCVVEFGLRLDNAKSRHAAPFTLVVLEDEDWGEEMPRA